MGFIVNPSVNVAALDMPLTHARIGYDSFVSESTVTGTSQFLGFPPDAVKIQTTWERWRPLGTAGEYLTIDAGASRSADYFGIAAHSLGSSGAVVRLSYSLTGASYTQIQQISVSGNEPVMLIFPEITARYWRITVVSSVSPPTVGVVYLGKVLAMQRPIYGGHSPINLSRQTVVRPTESEKGQWLGRSITRYGLQTSYNWNNLSAAWYRANFDPFVSAARFRPFFIAWRPASYPDEVAFGWTGDDIQPSNSGTRDLMSVSISVSAHADE